MFEREGLWWGKEPKSKITRNLDSGDGQNCYRVLTFYNKIIVVNCFFFIQHKK